MRLSGAHRGWIYWSSAALFATGALWLALHYFARTQGQFGETAHPLEIWCLRLHGACAMLVLVVIGSLLPIHVRRGWHLRKNLLAGWALGVLAFLLVASGYALYYVGNEATRPWISAFHWVLGLSAPLVLTWHVWRGHQEQAKRRIERGRAREAAAAQSLAHYESASARASTQTSGPSISA